MIYLCELIQIHVGIQIGSIFLFPIQVGLALSNLTYAILEDKDRFIKE